MLDDASPSLTNFTEENKWSHPLSPACTLSGALVDGIHFQPQSLKQVTAKSNSVLLTLEHSCLASQEDKKIALEFSRHSASTCIWDSVGLCCLRLTPEVLLLRVAGERWQVWVTKMSNESDQSAENQLRLVITANSQVFETPIWIVGLLIMRDFQRTRSPCALNPGCVLNNINR